MLEYFTVKKVKKHRDESAEKKRLNTAAKEKLDSIAASSKQPESNHKPVLTDDDERYFERIVSSGQSEGDVEEDEGPRPPLPPRIKTPVIEWDSDDASLGGSRQVEKPDDPLSEHPKTGEEGKGKEVATGSKADNKTNKRFSLFNISLKRNPTKKGLKPESAPVPEKEAEREKDELSQVLDDLNLSAQNNKAFSLSTESSELVRKFTVVLKDLVDGGPHAYRDLVSLLEDRDGMLAKNYEKLPGSMKKLVTTLPNKLTSTLAPELLAVAAEAQGLNAAEASKGGLKGAAKKFLTPKSLQDLVTKPGALVGLLKGIMNALKTRFPAFIGTNVLWSVGLFLLLFVLWYCHKRGREERLLKENADGQPIDDSDRFEELPDDPQLPAPAQAMGSTSTQLPPPPIGADSGRMA